MKELSIEEKAKRYDEALELMKDCVPDKNGLVHVRPEDIFPALKEGEDERIRKALIKFHKSTIDIDGIKGKDILTWLEKQGEEKPIMNVPSREVILSIWDLGNEWKELTNGCISTEYGTQLDYIQKHWQESEYYLRAKQGEQKPINNIEPKFNIGDTMRTLKEASKGITDGMPVVVSIDDEYYHCTNELIAIKDQDDYEFPPINMKQKPADKVAPKFKIGDFIVNNDSGDICQVTEIRDDEYCLWPLDAEIKGYLRFIDVDNEYHLWTIQDAKDGDVLAYVTDEEDLWIMIYWSLYEPYEGHVHYHALLVNDDFYDKGTCCICIDDLKPANKEQRNTLFAKMTEAGYEWDAEKKELKKIEHLRERYENIAQSEWFKRTHNGMSVSDEEPKWTKEDDERQISITEYLNELYDDNRFSLDELTDLKTWLKSLKQRIGWKPNKEQIKALHDLNLVGNISYVGQAQLLIELYNDLKKLIV